MGIRGAIVALGLVFFASSAFSGDREEDILPTARRAAYSGVLKLPRGEDEVFTARVFWHGPAGYAELLAEDRFRPGPFRLTFQGSGTLVLTSHGFATLARLAPSRDAGPQRLRPRPWGRARVEVVDHAGDPVEGATVRVISAPGALLYFRVPPPIARFATTTAAGVAALPVIEGIDTWLRVEAADAVTRWSIAQRSQLEGSRPVVLDRGPRILVVNARTATGALVPPGELTVRARGPGGFEEIVGQVEGEGWRGSFPRASSTLRIESEGHRPCLRVGLDPRRTEPLVLDAELQTASRLTVWIEEAGTAVKGPPPQCRLACGTGAVHRRRRDVRAEVRHVDSKAGWTPLQPVPRIDALRATVTTAGRYLLRVRGPLGIPRTREIELPAETDAHVAVDIGGGSGIRVVVRGRGGKAPEKISFRLEDAEGAPVAAEYTDARIDREPQWSHAGPAYPDVPNGGILRLDPGTYRVVFRDRSAVVFAYPGTITRLDTAFLKDAAKNHRVR